MSATDPATAGQPGIQDNFLRGLADGLDFADWLCTWNDDTFGVRRRLTLAIKAAPSIPCGPDRSADSFMDELRRRVSSEQGTIEERRRRRQGTWRCVQ
jgi:hypothetical protein